MNQYSNLNADPELYDEPRQERLEARFNALFNRYWNEYLQTARIADLDWNTEDLEVLSQQQEKSFREIIYNECAELVLITWD